MSTFAKSLKKQMELLQGEVELYANAIDSLAGELASARTQLAAYEKPNGDNVPQTAGDEIEPIDKAPANIIAAPLQSVV